MAGEEEAGMGGGLGGSEDQTMMMMGSETQSGWEQLGAVPSSITMNPRRGMRLSSSYSCICISSSSSSSLPYPPPPSRPLRPPFSSSSLFQVCHAPKTNPG